MLRRCPVDCRDRPRAMPATLLSQAPGKLVLMGEYAVLDGAPALVLAVHRGVGCEVSFSADTRIIDTPTDDDRFVGTALEAVAAPPARYRFFDLDPCDLPGKPGFGGSAAATVAAVLAGGGRGTEAFEVHHRVQGGGSGVDVAASLHGGLVRFQAGRVSAQPVVEPVVVFSGQAAQTGPRVAAYRAWCGDRDAFVGASTGLVDGFATDPIPAMAEAGALLASMARAAGIAYLTPGLERIAALARAHGGAAKPSGAGGGDCAVALLPDPVATRAFEAACGAVGLVVIPVRPAPGASVCTLDSTGETLG
jgi:phosphomevalonate kinase